ncbi:MAG TPA: peptide deformylase [Syntrophorhabdales bacterium]|nr:peptide deformylase [Syntrophorhabdales bacterium]
MAIHPIRKYPDPVLRKVADKVTDVSGELCRLSEDMIETMRAARGVGLAANQVGLAVRIITLDMGLEKESEPLVLINPEIIELASEETAEEGCLSLPGFYETVKRAKKVLVKAVGVDGKEFTMECEGLLARACQHEIDHLNGILFVDHLSPIKRQLFRKEYMKE